MPDDRAGSLFKLLEEAVRLQSLGRTEAEIRRALLAQNRSLPKPVPLISAGGLYECIDAALERTAKAGEVEA